MSCPLAAATPCASTWSTPRACSSKPERPAAAEWKEPTMTSEQHTSGNEPGAEPDAVTAFADRVFASALGSLELLSIYLGDRLGWYRALAAGEPLDPPTLAARTGTDERYAREW